jgi:hypothetical protein
MDRNNGWRFPNNNYGPENGLDTGDVETFKKDPEAAVSGKLYSIDLGKQKSIVFGKQFSIVI